MATSAVHRALSAASGVGVDRAVVLSRIPGVQWASDRIDLQRRFHTVTFSAPTSERFRCTTARALHRNAVRVDPVQTPLRCDASAWIHCAGFSPKRAARVVLMMIPIFGLAISLVLSCNEVAVSTWPSAGRG